MEGIRNKEKGSRHSGDARASDWFAFFLFPFSSYSERSCGRGGKLSLLCCALLPVASFFVTGCRNCHLVESELRSKENELRETRDELNRSESINEALSRELDALRMGVCNRIAPELAAQTYTLKEITLGRGTGGYDEDKHFGDEALQIVLEPRDLDGHAIKAPGSLLVNAFEIGPEGLKTPLSTWEISPDQLRRTWRSGLLSTGYYVILPWKIWPSSNKLRIIVRLTLPDGRAFEADKDVTIRSTKQTDRRAVPPAGEGPIFPPDAEPLPMPKAAPPALQLESRNKPSFWPWKTKTPDPAPVQRASHLAGAAELMRPVPMK